MNDSGLIFLDKPVGCTSRQVDNRIMRFFGTRKVGHLGTLDPFATGLLIIGINEGTKLLSIMEESSKCYRATMQLGEATTTGDLEGELVNSCSVPYLTSEDIESALASLVGTISQIPPIFSAIKVEGKPLYRYAQQGQEVLINPRKVEIFSLTLCGFNRDLRQIEFETSCSKGTYIRTLGEDIAKKLMTVGHLISLRRLAVNDISINKEYVSEIDFPRLIGIEETAKILGLPTVLVFPPFNGGKVTINSRSRFVLGLSPDQKPIALYEQTDQENIYRVKRGFHGTY